MKSIPLSIYNNNMYSIRKYLLVRRCLAIFSIVCIIQVILTLLHRESHSTTNHVDMALNKLNEDINMFSIAERMELRRTHLQEKCNIFGLNQLGQDNLHRSNPTRFLINSKYHLVWCNIFKSASTSWMYNFLILAGYNPKFLQGTNTILLNLAREEYPRPSLEELKEAINNSVSFLIVRHPLERILSAYREKLEGLPYNYLRNLGSRISSKYRTHRKISKLSEGPTFPEFVEYLLDSFKSKQEVDMHWTPIVEFCTPCMFDFKVIAHIETLEEDQLYLINKAGLEDILEPEWKNANREATSKTDIIHKYYSQLEKTTILQLYDVYRYDFELFNYTLQGYLEHGKNDKDDDDDGGDDKSSTNIPLKNHLFKLDLTNMKN